MPRGRHRQSPPLHRLLPSASVAVVSITCAAGAWLVGDTVVIRGLAATAAGAAVVGAVLLRRWDRSAGRRVAEAASETARQEMKYEERIAELEADAEKASELRTALNTRLRAKRAELARLRNEHAELLRRYATAETERASALEGRRRLALEAASPAKALEAGAAEATAPDEPDESAALLIVPSPAAYAKADEALSRLRESARRQKERREQAAAEGARTGASDNSRDNNPDTNRDNSPESDSEQAPETAPERDDRKGRREDRGKDGAATLGKPPAAGGQDGDGPQEPRAHARTAASAVVPYAAARRAASRSESGFDYFGTQKKHHPKKQKREPEPAAEEDLADVIGDETIAETRKGAVGEVIDLTAHDETEQIDLGELRSAIS
ncbi:hypothetical protein I1A49_21625 [Streptomyces malaysiensis subsp. malaysiensis]|uniref:Secreted protein n=1 Tax=Streptomyces malaysiensis TaxID=92644 RepID=A0ABX6W6V3_STRMQ|nr:MULTISPECIES: hypothetical protein [Streptomyces]QPI57165.1 hypothetical protein I1A49_21625 [Streptomyces solisilvae]UHH18707.1 hypothetical protein LUV23_21785 [Streptomyces sp. HNM0561]